MADINFNEFFKNPLSSLGLEQGLVVPGALSSKVETEKIPSTSSSSLNGYAPQSPLKVDQTTKSGVSPSVVKNQTAGIQVSGQRNILHGFENVSYHWKMMLTDIDSSNNVTSIDGFNPAKSVILAETGTTTMFNIRSVELETWIGPGMINRNGFGTGMTIVIDEPLGIQFFDALRASCLSLGVRQFQSVPVFIQLTFLGYDKTTQQIVSIPAAARLWKMKISNIEVLRHDSSGTQYAVKGFGFGDMGLIDTKDVLDRAVNCADVKTVGEYLQNLQDGLKSTAQSAYGKSRAVVDEWEFKVDSTIAALSLRGSNPEQEASRTGSMTTKNTAALISNIPPGTSISQVLEFLMTSVEDNVSKNFNIYGTNETLKANRNRIWMVSSETKMLEFDYVLNDYARKYIINIQPFETAKGIIDIQTSKAKYVDVGFQNERVLAAQCVKVYNYLYTGLNTDVLKFDFNIDTMWYASLPLYAGINTSPSVGDGKKFSTELEEKKKRLMEAQKKYSQASKDFDTIKDRDDVDISFKREARDALVRAQAEAQAITSEFQGYSAKAQQAATAGQPLTVYRYAEQFTQDKSALAKEMMIAGTIDNNTLNDRTKVMEQTKKDYVTVASAVMNQVYSISGDMVDVTLDIIGDPYWLGNAENLQNNRGITTHPNDKDCTFFVRFKTPRAQLNELGLMDFDTSDTISGLYIVHRVMSRFESGQFTQSLKGIKDVQINHNYVQSGQV